MNLFQSNQIRRTGVLLIALLLFTSIAFSQSPLLSPYNGNLSKEQQNQVEKLETMETTKRLRVVYIDVADFAAQSLLVNPFSGITIPLQQINLGHTGIKLASWSGNDPASYSSGSFVFMGRRVSGHVSGIAGNFEIFPMGDEGVHAVVEHDNNAFGGCGNAEPSGVNPPKPGNEKEKEDYLRREHGNEQLPPGGQWNSLHGTVESNGAECFVRVLVGFTALAQTNTQSTFGRSMIEHVSLAVLESNQGYANSNVEQRMELAYLYLTDDDETGSACDDLDAMNDANDGKWDEMYTHRSTFRADMTCLITGGLYGPFSGCNTNGLCGRAFGFDYTDANNMFQVSEFSCATGNFTFAHEFGHNQGCRHDNDNTGSPFSYARGFNEGTNFRTIMAVCCSPNRVNWWSNPDVNYLTFGATGTATRDNARALDVGDATYSHFQTTPLVLASSANLPDDHWANIFATDQVNSSDVAEDGSRLEVKSFGTVVLTTGFHAKSGSNARAWIAAQCGGVSFAKTGNSGSSTGSALSLLPSSSPDEGAAKRLPILSVYPNPVVEQFQLTLEQLPAHTRLRVQLIDPSGKVLQQLVHNEPLINGSYRADFSTEKLSDGLYYLLVEADDFREVRKLVKSD